MWEFFIFWWDGMIEKYYKVILLVIYRFCKIEYLLIDKINKFIEIW